MKSSRNRKIAYMLLIVGLFTVLVGLGQAIERSAEANKLAQKSLGKIDPVKGTAQLVLLGFRGVAATFLWHQAIELKKQERWFEIRPVLESITLLQPNFTNPWTFQAWNMAYNIAAEWESVADKYYWIRQGVDFMKEAVATNKNQPDMEWYVGWLYYNRFGMSDEKMFLREMFRKDPDVGFSRSSTGESDSFLVAYDAFDVANKTVINQRIPPKQRGITPFLSYPAMSKTNYASFRGQEGKFGDLTSAAWLRANNEWLQFGRMGEPGRYAEIHRLEYSPDEWSKLTDEERFWADHYAKIVNYYYWKRRTQIEGTTEMQGARESFYIANKALKEADYLKALEEFEKGFIAWRKIIESDSEFLKSDDVMRDDSQENEGRYLRLLTRLGMPVPETLAPRPMEGIFDPAVPTPTSPGYRDLQRSTKIGEAEPTSPPGAPTDDGPPSSTGGPTDSGVPKSSNP